MTRRFARISGGLASTFLLSGLTVLAVSPRPRMRMQAQPTPAPAYRFLQPVAPPNVVFLDPLTLTTPAPGIDPRIYGPVPEGIDPRIAVAAPSGIDDAIQAAPVR